MKLNSSPSLNRRAYHRKQAQSLYSINKLHAKEDNNANFITHSQLHRSEPQKLTARIFSGQHQLLSPLQQHLYQPRHPNLEQVFHHPGLHLANPNLREFQPGNNKHTSVLSYLRTADRATVYQGKMGQVISFKLSETKNLLLK